ncbi:MerR family transcriptional regulator [Vandammella animalimorsus]|uniref:MerR family transcriptional regulator n=1 Tax=Vandammella animalimorsus TaxID=2029117 RepID=UPI00325BB65B
MTRATTAVTLISEELIELLDDAALSLEQFASGCRMAPDWVRARVQAGVLQAEAGVGEGQWRFTSATLVRARRIAHLEHAFDADPQLAALTTDLMEEVAALRQQLQALGAQVQQGQGQSGGHQGR